MLKILTTQKVRMNKKITSKQQFDDESDKDMESDDRRRKN